MSEDKPARTDRELLVLIYERQKTMGRDIEEIKVEKKTSNGRLSKLELWQAGINGTWKTVLIVSALISFVVTIVIHYFSVIQ